LREGDFDFLSIDSSFLEGDFVFEDEGFKDLDLLVGDFLSSSVDLTDYY